MHFTEIDVPIFTLDDGDCRNRKAYLGPGLLAVLASEDNTPTWGWLKHVSVSYPTRYPTWDEILQVKDHFMGDIDCMMVMPKKTDYVNVHRYCFHIWQCPEGWGIR